jgi:hypothetical protein
MDRCQDNRHSLLLQRNIMIVQLKDRMMMTIMMTLIVYKLDFNAHEHVLDARTCAKIQI